MNVLTRWRTHYGDAPEEAQTLEAMITERLRHELTGDPLALQQAELFTQYQFGRHLRNYETFASPYAYGFSVARALVTASGLVASAVAGIAVHPSWARWVLFGLGLLTSITTLTLQIWKPGLKAESRFKGAAALRQESYAFLGDLRQYGALSTHKERLALFQDRVLEIVHRTAEADRAAFGAMSDADRT